MLSSWGSIVVRMGGLALLLPLALANLPAEEVSVWLLFSSILALQGLVDFGLSPTFARAIAYTQAAATPSTSTPAPGAAVPGAIGDVILAMRRTYARLVGVVFLLVSTGGTAALVNPISHMAQPSVGWIAWSIVVVGSAGSVYNILYASVLQGINQIALLRRWEILTNLVSIGGAIAALSCGFGLLGMVVMTNAGTLLGVFVNRRLCRSCTPPSVWTQQTLNDPSLPSQIWSTSWRSGLGVMMTFGVIQGSGIIYAQVAPPMQVASFLFTQRLLQIISSMVQVPFYTRIPTLARLYAERQTERIIGISRTGMVFSNWLLVGIVIAGWLVMPPLMRHIGSDMEPPSAALWWSMSMALLLERSGAMYLQTYSITNHIVWHVANGVSGLLMLFASVPMYARFGALGIPFAWIFGYACFYFPYSAYVSVKAFPPRNFGRDFWATGLPLLVVTSLFVAIVCLQVIP